MYNHTNPRSGCGGTKPNGGQYAADGSENIIRCEDKTRAKIERKTEASECGE